MFNIRKQFIVVISLLLLSFIAKAQVINNLVVFCNEPEPFTLILNGERQNAIPQTSVRVEGLTLAKYSVRIVFSSGKPKDHSTTLTFYSTGTECVFALNKHGKKKYTMDYLSEKPIPGFEKNTNPNTDSNVNSTDTTNATNTNTQTTNTGNPAQNPPVTPNNTNNNGVGINLPGIGNVGFGNGNVSIHGNVAGMGVNVNQPVKTKPTPMTDEQFISYTNQVSQQITDSSKQDKALELLKKKHISVGQIKDVLALFSTEQSKLDFCKKVYPFTSDKEDFRKLIDVFITDASKKDLNDFIDNK